jgi:hypothetical protein
VLTYAISLSIQPSCKLIIHNLCLNVDLVSPIYINVGKSECYRPPKCKVSTGDVMRSVSIIELDDVFVGGVLIYELQRKRTCESTETGKDTSSTIHLLVAWKFSESKLYANIQLVECEKGFYWNKGDLKYLYRKNFGRLKWSHGSATETWLLDNNIALRAAFEIMDENCALYITLSEVERYNTKASARNDLER